MALDAAEARNVLLHCVGRDHSNSWVTRVTVVTASEQIEGLIKAVNGDHAIVDTATGERRVPIADVHNVLVHLESQGPE